MMTFHSGFSRLIRKGPLAFADCLRAIYELAQANRRFRRLPQAALLDLAANHDRQLPVARSIEIGVVERVAFAVPGMARRVPWRADCMVQAIAAQSWLNKRGIASTMTIGVCKDAEAGFGAHAWLIVDGMIVTGGDISKYVPLDLARPAPFST